MTFDDLRLAEPILRSIRAEGYTHPTPIQVKAIPLVMEGRDVLGCAQTGTGKTAAFALPILHRLGHSGSAGVRSVRSENHSGRESLQGRRRESGVASSRIRVLVLAPTRELAAQIGESFVAYGRNTALRSTVIFGGVNQNPQVRALQAGVEILVATPGRLLDLMEQGYLQLGRVEVLVLDEADRMLDMGFIRDIRRIVAQVPRERQTLLFSATMPPEIRELANDILRAPVSVQVAPVAATADKIEQSLYFVEKREKPAMLAHLLNTSAVTRALVFTRTKHGADKVTRLLSKAGIVAEAIHGNKSQNARVRAMNRFKSSAPPVLVATDIAARGLDIDEISHVFNYDLPNEPETYVHRIGRTGRAGASGLAVSFCSVEERPFLRDIERLIRRPIPVSTSGAVPSLPAIEQTARFSSETLLPHPGRSQSRGQNGSRGRRQGSRQDSRPVEHAGAARGDTATLAVDSRPLTLQPRSLPTASGVGHRLRGKPRSRRGAMKRR